MYRSVDAVFLGQGQRRIRYSHPKVKRSCYLCQVTSTRERIIAESEPVFDQFGFAATGVDRLTEAAGVSSRTLYKHLGSKSALIAAVLDARRGRFLHSFDVTTVDDLFSALASWVRVEGARGCLFLRALGEGGEADSEIAATVSEYRAQLHQLMGRLVRNSTGTDNESLTEQLIVLFEGATSAASYWGARATTAARTAAATLLAEWPPRPAAQEL